jgi:hypothetical protein
MSHPIEPTELYDCKDYPRNYYAEGNYPNCVTVAIALYKAGKIPVVSCDCAPNGICNFTGEARISPTPNDE